MRHGAGLGRHTPTSKRQNGYIRGWWTEDICQESRAGPPKKGLTGHHPFLTRYNVTRGICREACCQCCNKRSLKPSSSDKQHRLDVFISESNQRGQLSPVEVMTSSNKGIPAYQKNKEEEEEEEEEEDQATNEGRTSRLHHPERVISTRRAQYKLLSIDCLVTNRSDSVLSRTGVPYISLPYPRPVFSPGLN